MPLQKVTSQRSCTFIHPPFSKGTVHSRGPKGLHNSSTPEVDNNLRFAQTKRQPPQRSADPVHSQRQVLPDILRTSSMISTPLHLSSSTLSSPVIKSLRAHPSRRSSDQHLHPMAPQRHTQVQNYSTTQAFGLGSLLSERYKKSPRQIKRPGSHLSSGFQPGPHVEQTSADHRPSSTPSSRRGTTTSDVLTL